MTLLNLFKTTLRAGYLQLISLAERSKGSPREKLSGKGMATLIVVIVAAFHVLAVLVAGVFVIARKLLPAPPALEVKNEVLFPAKVRKHRVEMRKIEAARPHISAQEVLKNIYSAPLSLPQLPSLPKLDSALASNLVTELTSDEQGSGGVGWETSGSSSFFGVETKAKRILILYDVSKTVVNAAARTGIPMVAVQRESKRLIEKLGIHCRFSLAQFARNYAFFSENLLSATDDNRKKATEWLKRWFATTGMMPISTPNLVSGSPGFLELLERAFRLQPQVVYILSDGNFYRNAGPIPYSEVQTTLRKLQEKCEPPVTIHFLAIGIKDQQLKELRKILMSYGGTIRKL